VSLIGLDKPLVACRVKVERFVNDREVKTNRNGQNWGVTGKSGNEKGMLGSACVDNCFIAYAARFTSNYIDARPVL